MEVVVQKFGGSSVATAEKIFRVAGRIIKAYDSGKNVVVVVSAQGDTTDDLIKKAEEINPKASKREMDVLLSTGEQISISLLAMAIEKLGYPVVSLTGWQAGFETDKVHSNARIRKIDDERVSAELDRRRIVIVAGFQGIDKHEDITTLGRGGSDTSAVALAATLKAEICQIFTDVDGVYTADPRIVSGAVKLDEITYDEMLELATAGAQVLHNRSVEMAKKYKVNLEVLSSIQDKPGTKIKEVIDVEKLLIKGVAKDDNVVRISVLNMPEISGLVYKMFSLLAAKDVNVDIILQSPIHNGKIDISFTVPMSQKDLALETINNAKNIFGSAEIECDENSSKISIVGSGMATHSGVAAKMFEALAEANVDIHLISTSEIKLSVLVNRTDSVKALKAVHDVFFN